MATDAGEIDRKRGPGAAGPSVLHDPPLTRHSSAAEVVLSYLRDQVAAIARYDPLVRRDEPDAVHQMRVATRRARSALQAFGTIIDREATRPLGEELKWLAVTLGQARDAEVMLDRLKASLAGIPPALVTGPVQARITAHFTAELAQAGKTAVAALDGRRYRRLRDDLDGLLVGGRGTRQAGPAGPTATAASPGRRTRGRGPRRGAPRGAQGGQKGPVRRRSGSARTRRRGQPSGRRGQGPAEVDA